MSRQAIEEKAKQYLLDGKVSIREAESSPGRSRASFRVQGSSPKPYLVSVDSGGWVCDCPAMLECAHIVACKTIFQMTYDRTVRLNRNPGKDLDEFFRQFEN